MLNLIELMDSLLIQNGLDLHFTTYKVISTKIDEGIVQFVNAKSLAAIIQDHKDLAKYLSGGSICNGQIMDVFVKSCGSAITNYSDIYITHLFKLVYIPSSSCLNTFIHVNSRILCGYLDYWSW